MKLLFEEYSDLIISLIGGIIILAIIIESCLQTKLDIMHSESINKINPILEKIDSFECKDVLLNDLNDDLLKDVSAYSNTGKDIKEYVIPRVKNDGDKYYIEYILKYNNDFRIKRVKCYIKEEEDYENHV